MQATAVYFWSLNRSKSSQPKNTRMKAGINNNNNGNRVALFMLVPYGIVLLQLLLLSAKETDAKPFDLFSIIGGSLKKIIDNAYVEGDIDLLDYPCQYKRIPYMKSWEVHYKAEVTCLGWTPIVGSAKDHLNPTRAEQAAVKDFVKQALEKGLVTEAEAKPWL